MTVSTLMISLYWGNWTGNGINSVRNLNGPAADWQVYPNPAIDKIVVYPSELNGEVMTIYNAIGAIVKQVTVTNNQVDVSGLAPGVYSLAISKKEYANAIRKLILVR
jgi:hypothetical protein